MARLPQPGGDSGNWGTILNDYLSQAHKTDGTLKADAVSAVNVADSTITEAKLASSVQAKLNAVPALSDLSDVNTTGVTTSQILSYDGSSSEWKPVTPTVTSQKIKWESVKDHGAIGNGSADDTAAIAATVTAAHTAGAAIYFPEGSYRVTAFPNLNDFDVIVGDGGDLSTIIYEGAGHLVTVTGKQRVSFRTIGFWITGVSGKGIHLDGSFRCSFESVVIRGSHTSGNYPTYVSTVGVTLDGNSGGTSFNNCDFNNFGTGMSVACIQNYITNSKFATNIVGVLGTGNTGNAGLSIANTEFVSDLANPASSKHIYIDGMANDWWLTNVWFEGASNGIVVGVAGTGGPSQFGMVNCKVAAKNTCINLQHCRQPYLANVIFDSDPGGSPVELVVNSSYCAEGTAIGLISGFNQTVPDSAFPQYWTVIGRGSSMMTSLTRTLTLRDPSGGTSDLLMAQNSSYNDIASILSSGAYLSNRATAGIILKSPNGHYWRMTVNDAGTTSTSDLGTGRPFS